jgi:hypothetical protein
VGASTRPRTRSQTRKTGAYAGCWTGDGESEASERQVPGFLESVVPVDRGQVRVRVRVLRRALLEQMD